MENKILVTGATGNIGRGIIEVLKAKNANFVAGINNREAIEGVETVNADFADKDSLEKAMQGITTLFMVLPNHTDMVKWGENIIDAAKKSGVKHIVRSSGSLADENSTLAINKLLASTDKSLRESGIDYSISKPSFFMQNFVNFFAEDYKNGNIYQSSANGKVSWTDVRDVAAVNVELLMNPEKYKGKEFVVTGSESLSYTEAIAKMNSILSKDANYVAIADSDVEKALEDLQFPKFAIDLMINLNQNIAMGLAEETSNSIEQLLGRKPILFDQFVKDNKEVWL